MKTRKISIRLKIIVLNLSMVNTFALIFYTLFLPRIEARLMDRKQQIVKEAVSLGSSLLLSIYKAEQEGKLTREEAQTEAIETIRELRYEKDSRNYLWINDFTPTMIMHPYATKLNGQSLKDYKDPFGKHLFVEMAEVSKKNGGGFVHYHWQYFDEKDNIVPKVSYVQAFTPWGWIIGSGVYINDVQAEISELTRTITVGFVLVAFISSVAIFFFSSRIVRPIQDLRKATVQIARGDLRSTVSINSRDEMVDLANDFNSVIGSMRKVLSTIIQHSIDLASSTEEMSSTLNHFTTQAQNQSASTEEIAATTEELAAGMEAVERSSDQQTQSVQHLIQTMQELSLKIDQMSQTVLAAIEETTQINRLVRNGETSLGQMNESMNSVLNSSKSVTGIVQIINEISDRINLLSLNAAIEAARAGDAGRGFAVVAEEVGKLAVRTSTSIREISDLVEENDQRIHVGINQLHTTTDAIGGILTGMNRMNDRMTDLRQSMKGQIDSNDAVKSQLGNVSMRSNEIKKAIKEQRNAVAEIAVSVSDINDAIQGVVAASEQMTGNSEQIARMAEGMREQTTFFKL